MATIQELWTYAQLSQAAYADPESTSLEEVLRALTDADRGDDRFALAQASHLFNQTDGFNIVDLGANQNDAFGFSSTLFQNNASGQYVLAIRGTEDATAADLNYSVGEITNWGVASHQIVSMYNYFQRLITPAGELVKQLQLNTHTEEPAGTQYAAMANLLPGLPDLFLSVTTTYAPLGIGTLANLAPGTKISVAGHSLGGHLGQALARLFPEWVSDVYAHNTAGFNPDNADAFFGLILSDASFFDSSRIHNIFSYNGGEYITNDQIHTQYGERLGLLIEHQLPTATANHSITLQARSLSLHSLFEQIAPTFDVGGGSAAPYFSKIDGILRSAANNHPTTYEATLQSLVKLFLNEEISVESLEPLETFYNKLYAVKDAIGSSGAASLVSLVAEEAASIAANTAMDIGYRYALKQLNSYAVLGNTQIYGSHNANEQLELFTSLTQTGTLTGKWVGDRAALLESLMLANSTDSPNGQVHMSASGTALHEYHYFAHGSERILFAYPSNAYSDGTTLPTQVILFADDAGRVLNGTDYALGDRIYGGEGDDHLLGLAGDDYLEANGGSDIVEGGFGEDELVGGAGNDILKGGADWDTYVVGRGHDRIIDDDGFGLIMDAARRQVSGIFVKNGSVYVSALDPTIQASLTSDLTIGLSSNASVVLEGYEDDDLGIRLVEQMDAPGAPGNGVMGTATLDVLTAGAGGSLLEGLGETDYLAGEAGDDVLLGGDGFDWLSGNLGNNWMEGGAGPDVILTGAGNDYANGGADTDFIVNFGAMFTLTSCRASTAPVLPMASASRGFCRCWVFRS